MDDISERFSSAGGAFAPAAASAASHIQGNFGSIDTISRASTPGLAFREKTDEEDKKRYRPRTFSYFSLLPFEVEEESERDAALRGILKNLYTALMAEDFAPGALHWTRELQGWLNLKFEMTRELRARLALIYYRLCLAPGMDSVTQDRFCRMLITLTRKRHYLKPGEDLVLDWRCILKELKVLVFPSEAPSHQSSRRRSQKHLLKLALHANPYFDPADRREMLEELLPFFSTSDLSNAYIVIAAMNIMIPTAPAPPTAPQSQPADFMPTFFHLWSLMSRSKSCDVAFIDIFSRMAKDYMSCTHVPFNEHGIFTKEQSDLIFTAILRLTEIPVGQANSPYSSIDYSAGLGVLLDKDKKKYPVPYMIARWIVHSLTPICLTRPDSILTNLEGLIESIETFFHPSNQGGWTSFLAQLIFFLTDIFVSRWNREQSGELDLPVERRITPELKRAFVKSLRDVTFMGLFGKSSRVVNYYYSSLQGLSYLEPDLMLPGALQRFYPSLQGLVEVHRTTASLCGLQMIANIMSKQKGYRCHITALLALALPGIDANDLNKTQYTLNFIQSVAYSIPFDSLVNEDVRDTGLAQEFVQGEMERMAREGQDVVIDYANELDDRQEANILRSSTAGFGEFVMALLGKVFTLLENLPDASHIRSNTPEENVINTLPATFTPLFATLSPELFDLALEKLSNFIASHVVHQARDAMAWICNALCKVNPEKTLKVFIPMLIANIRNEIDFNGAASDRSSGSEVLPRDRALVWNVSMLSMCVVHVGSEVLKYKKELLDIAQYMQEKCKGLPTIHISNYIHHLLLNLTHTYTLDNALYEPDVVKRGLGPEDWGRTTAPSDLSIRWHRASQAELEFAVELFESQTRSASQKLEELMSENPPVSQKGKNKEWSDELSRSLAALRLVISGVATLFDPQRASGETGKTSKPATQINGDGGGADGGEQDTMMDEDDDPLAEVADDEELRRQFRYPAGYLLEPDSPIYNRLHDTREDIGRLLSRTHTFLNASQEDDVTCFTHLYSTYRTWITDVGIERSAHPFERLVRLYKADIAPFKISGLRKVYPRPLLIRRADAYQLQRVKYNAVHRKKSDLDKQLLLDLAESCVSSYADVRRVAQGALDSSLKVLIAGRTLVIPVILDRFREALDNNDHDRIKGAMYTLFFSGLQKTLIRDWRFAPDMMRLYIRSSSVDKQSIQKLGSTAAYQIYELGRQFEHMVLFDKDVVNTIQPPDEDCSATIQKRHSFILERREKVEQKKAQLGLELIEVGRTSHWKIANRCAMYAMNMCIRFETLAPSEFIDLVAKGTNDPHPSLRANYQTAFSSLCAAIDLRALYSHSYEAFLLEQESFSDTFKVQVPTDDPHFTARFLGAFGEFENAEYFVDNDYAGWLVWGKEFTASKAKPVPFLAYDEVETAARQQIGKILTKDWFKTHFEYLKQEPRDANDRFRMQNVVFLQHMLDLVNYGVTDASFEDIKELVKDVYGDGSDKHQHRATSEILGAMLSGTINDPPEYRQANWGFAAPMMLKIMADDLTPDNLQYWMTCLHQVIDGRDPRKAKEILQSLSAFRLDMSSNAAFKESSKVQLLELIVHDAGWHFRREEPILEDFLAHIDHPYKTVRESIGRVIATIYLTRYHESFPNVTALLEANKADSSVGIRPYKPSEDFSSTITEVFSRLEKWRHERTPGQQTPSSYTNGSKTVLMWLDSMLTSQECTQLVPFFSTLFMKELLHMMDVKEDPELMKLAYHVYRHLPNIPLRAGEDEAFLSAIIQIGKEAASWHQRLRALINMQVIYFRRLFLTGPQQRELLFDAIGDMLEDAQLEVREAASATLAGMIRCSPNKIRSPIIDNLKERFMTQLRKNPMPKRKNPGTDTPVDTQKQVLRRHAAVLGLGALVEAFPYATPPPSWLPGVLAHLARHATDPGVVGKTTKGILSDFKKTRQDSWSVDQLYFTPEQLEDLEGVLWKSYFA